VGCHCLGVISIGTVGKLTPATPCAVYISNDNKLACNYVSFFDKLSDLFEQLNKRIPAYNDLSAVLDRLKTQVTVSQEFSTSLHAFYVDIFEIFRGIARVFTQKTGSTFKISRVRGMN
jgi:hypothetical protein